MGINPVTQNIQVSTTRPFEELEPSIPKCIKHKADVLTLMNPSLQKFFQNKETTDHILNLAYSIRYYKQFPSSPSYSENDFLDICQRIMESLFEKRPEYEKLHPDDSEYSNAIQKLFEECFPHDPSTTQLKNELERELSKITIYDIQGNKSLLPEKTIRLADRVIWQEDQNEKFEMRKASAGHVFCTTKQEEKVGQIAIKEFFAYKGLQIDNSLPTIQKEIPPFIISNTKRMFTYYSRVNTTFLDLTNEVPDVITQILFPLLWPKDLDTLQKIPGFCQSPAGKYIDEKRLESEITQKNDKFKAACDLSNSVAVSFQQQIHQFELLVARLRAIRERPLDIQENLLNLFFNV